jgi:hypothetical protein
VQKAQDSEQPKEIAGQKQTKGFANTIATVGQPAEQPEGDRQADQAKDLDEAPPG